MIEKLEDIKDIKDQKLVRLLQDMVRIPSWVSSESPSTQNENQMVDYLESWIKENTNFDITRQALAGGRYNLIASKGEPKLVFLGHTDTVQPSENAQYNQLAAEIHSGKVWGRGTTDMKSGIAAILQALSLTPDAENTWMFLYADEEYDFLGMKALVSEYSDIRPELMVSSDGSDLKLGHGCRGLIEFRARVTGETGHPARGTGNSAIWGSIESLKELTKDLKKYNHPVMGGTSFNLAYVLGGALLPDSISENGGRLAKVGQAGNVVSDALEFVVDIRPSSPDLDLNKVTNMLSEILEKKGLEFNVINKTHDLGAWYTKLDDIQEFVEIVKGITKKEQVSFDNPGDSGYIDLQMLWNKVGRPKSLMFGGGNGDTAHKPDEHIKIEDLIKERDFFRKVLENHS